MIGKVSQFDALQGAIQFAVENHRVTQQNIANLNTPGYRTKGLTFDQYMDAIKNPPTGDSTGLQMQEVAGLEQRNDGNNVDLDRELAAMKKNALAYQTLTQLLGTKMGILKQAIQG